MATEDSEENLSSPYVVMRHKFDASTNHFRWMPEVAFDNKREWKKYLKKACAKLELQKNSGQAHYKEQISGLILEPKKQTQNNFFTLMMHLVLNRKNYLPGYETGYAEYKVNLKNKGEIFPAN
jgi:hypothetical protein